jgi:uncharacterized protein (TIGR02147 family)
MKHVHLILKKFFALKQSVNPKYSLRSLARDLGVNPSFVSRVLAGKQEITPSRLDQFIQLLNIDAVAAKELKLSLVEEYMRELGVHDTELLGRAEFSVMDYEDRQLTLKEMNILNPWFNIAILEFTALDEFVHDAQAIAKRLGLRVDQVEKSLSYLLNNGYLEQSEQGLKKTSKKLRLPTQKSHETVRFFHKAMMELAVKEMFQKTDDQSFNARLVTSTSIATNSKKIAQAKERIAAFQLEIAELLHEEPCDEVYDLTIALFPMTTKSAADVG